LARHVNASLRHTDSAGRYGGEEFVLLFPQTSAESASFVLNRVREEFGRSEHYIQSGGPFSTTFSGGIATYPEHGETPEALLREADDALYISKKEGRNRLTIADPQSVAGLERPLLPNSVNS
jgi:diguanylate cyclase (GGDEF)-like protein